MSEKENETENQRWTVFHSLHATLVENEKKREERANNRSLGGAVLSIIGGVLILMNIMTLNWRLHPFAVNMMAVSGILVMVMALFMYLDRKRHVFWGGIVLFFSGLSYFALGLAAGTWQIIPVALAFVLGVSGGSLGIFGGKSMLKINKKEVKTYLAVD